MKTTIIIRERIAVRAYFAWLKHYQAGVVNAVLPGNDLGYWLAAERIELGLAERRAAAASKAAAARRLAKPKKVTASEYEQMVGREMAEFVPAPSAIAATRRPAGRRAIAH